MKRFSFLAVTIMLAFQMMAGNLGNIHETCWHDGFALYHAIENNGVIDFQGGTLHEGGYGFKVVKGRGGKMVAMSIYDGFESLTTSGRSVSRSTIERRTVNGQDLLLITSPEGKLTDVLIAVVDGNLTPILENQMNQMLDGVYTDGKGNTFSFDGFGKMSVRGVKNGKWDAYNYIYIDESPSNMFEYLPLDKHYSFEPNGYDLKLNEVTTKKGKSWDDDDLDLVTVKSFKIKKSKGMRYTGKGFWPITSEEVLTAGYLGFYDLESLRLMRNDIYARHGYIFKDKALRKVFAGQSWYKPTTSDASSLKLNETERINIALIQNMEKIKSLDD